MKSKMQVYHLPFLKQTYLITRILLLNQFNLLIINESKENFNLSENICSTIYYLEDYPGLIANRVLMPCINKSIYALYEAVSTFEGIGKALRLRTNVLKKKGWKKYLFWLILNIVI